MEQTENVAPMTEESETESIPAPVPVTAPTVKKVRKVKRTNAELLREIGQMKIANLKSALAPDEKELETLNLQRAKLERYVAEFQNVPEDFRDMALERIEALTEIVEMREKMLRDSSSINEEDGIVLVKGVLRAIRSGKANKRSMAIFLHDNRELFPMKGSKY